MWRKGRRGPRAGWDGREGFVTGVFDQRRVHGEIWRWTVRLVGADKWREWGVGSGTVAGTCHVGGGDGG